MSQEKSNLLSNLDFEQLVDELEEKLGAREASVNQSPVADLSSRLESEIGQHTQTRLDMAFGLLEMGLLSEAKSLLDQIEESEPEHWLAQALKARVYIRKGDVRSGAELLEKVASESKSDQLRWFALYERAETFISEKNLAAAVDIFRRIRKESPHYRDVRSRISEIEKILNVESSRE